MDNRRRRGQLGGQDAFAAGVVLEPPVDPDEPADEDDPDDDPDDEDPDDPDDEDPDEDVSLLLDELDWPLLAGSFLAAACLPSPSAEARLSVR